MFQLQTRRDQQTNFTFCCHCGSGSQSLNRFTSNYKTLTPTPWILCRTHYTKNWFLSSCTKTLFSENVSPLDVATVYFYSKDREFYVTNLMRTYEKGVGFFPITWSVVVFVDVKIVHNNRFLRSCQHVHKLSLIWNFARRSRKHWS